MNGAPLVSFRPRMSDRPSPCVVVFVADVARVAAFYREIASMTVLLERDDHVALEIDGLQVVLHGLSGEPAVTRDDSGQVPVRQDAYVKLCLPVGSIETARATAVAHGGVVKPPEHEWEARGFRACDGHDPEGNVIQVREPLRVRDGAR
jgi:predicted enzyme related to lactoylglutathione lyase